MLTNLMLTNVDNYLSVLPARHELQSKTPAHRDKESCGLPKLSTQRSGIFTFCQVYPKFTCFLSWLFLAAIIHARTHTTHCVRASVLPRASFPLSASTRTLHAPSASPKKKKKTIWHGEAWIRSPPRLESTLGNTALSLQKYAGVAFVSVARAVRVTGREIGASINKWMKQKKRLRFSLANPFVNGSTLVIEHLAYIYGPYISSVATILFRGK